MQRASQVASTYTHENLSRRRPYKPSAAATLPNTRQIAAKIVRAISDEDVPLSPFLFSAGDSVAASSAEQLGHHHAEQSNQQWRANAYEQNISHRLPLLPGWLTRVCYDCVLQLLKDGMA